jgi:hypothetical protein
MRSCSNLARGAALVVAALSATEAQAQVPSAAPGELAIASLHAEGVQIYQCKPDSGKPSPAGQGLTWQFIEPVAGLFVAGKHTGLHYAGPNWDHIDGSGVKGKVIASAPGATAMDIPWLKLDVTDHRGKGMLSDATAVLRVNTIGGLAQGPCERAGEYLSVSYAADYIFLYKGE